MSYHCISKVPILVTLAAHSAVDLLLAGLRSRLRSRGLQARIGMVWFGFSLLASPVWKGTAPQTLRVLAKSSGTS